MTLSCYFPKSICTLCHWNVARLCGVRLCVSSANRKCSDICIKLQEPNYFTIQDIKEDLEKIFRTKVDIISLGAIMRNFFKKSLEEDAIYI